MSVRRWLRSTSNRTFVVYPLLVVAIEWALHRGAPVIAPWALPLLAWGLALALQSWFGAVLFVVHIVWFQRRVVRDEAHLREQFGTRYDAYAARVKRWVPGVV